MFMPSKEILETIGWYESSEKYDEVINMRKYTVFPGDTHELSLATHLEQFHKPLRGFYHGAHGINTEDLREEMHKATVTLWETLQNAKFHGSKEGRHFIHGMFVAKNGLCNGVYDQGGYFRRPEIKQQFENRTPITKFDLEYREGFRIGVNEIIFEDADIIEVDSKKGILYCAHLFKG